MGKYSEVLPENRMVTANGKKLKSIRSYRHYYQLPTECNIIFYIVSESFF